MSMNETFIADTCKRGQGADCCSFLVMGRGGFECAKGTEAEPVLVERRKSKSINAMGDNCSGPPDFKSQY